MARVLTPDLCVIGAGAAGLSVASGAVQMGASVVLIEGGAMGGDCLNHGCVPSKALIAAAHAAHAMSKGGPGVAGQVPQVDFAAVMAHVDAARATIAPHDSQARFEALGVTVLRGWARFTDARSVQVEDTTIRARRFVIATGSRPRVPNLPGLADVRYLTNETVFDLKTLPQHLLVLGGGPIGVELAQAFRRLGAAVTVVQSRAILPREDADAAALIRARLLAEGVVLHENCAAARVARSDAGVTLTLSDGREIAVSHLLLAVGRSPALDRLNLPAAGIATTAQGIATDTSLRTTNPRVFAIGDAAGREQFTHVAGYHAGLVIRQALFGMPARLRSDHLPRVTYADPELAQIGLTEGEARAAHGDAVTVIRSDFARNDRAVTEAAPDGFLKLMVVKGRPVGVTIIGQGAGDLLAPWSLALSQRLKLSAVAGMVIAYPTRSDIGKAAAGAYFSPKLFANPWVKRFVRLVQRWLA